MNLKVIEIAVNMYQKKLKTMEFSMKHYHLQYHNE